MQDAQHQWLLFEMQMWIVKLWAGVYKENGVAQAGGKG